jgi:hypothetical protein
MKARVLQHLLNGGGGSAGLSGLQAEINTIQEVMDGHRRELAVMPARRAELLLSDDPDAELDRLELAERAAYRRLERGTMQIDALEERMGEMRRAAIRPLIDRHRAALMAVSEKVEAAVLAAMAANAEAATAFADAVAELGQDDANRLVPVVHFAGFLNNDGVQFWREQLNAQNERIAREHGRATL